MNYDKSSIIFVVERSLPMKRYITEMIDSYISPALNNFCGDLNEDSDVFFKQSSPVQFGVVFFGSESRLSNAGGQLVTVGPTTSPKEVLTALTDASYTCENTNRQASIIEGLHAASALFSKLDRNGSNRAATTASPVTANKKLAILVTQSTPLHHPWAPATLEHELKGLRAAGIKLSVLGCHKLAELYRVFEASGGDLPAAAHKNYAARPNHLVLLSGLVLPEHDNPPAPASSSNNTTQQQQQPVTSSNQQQQQSPAAAAMNPSPQQQVASVGSPASHHQQQQMTSQQMPTQGAGMRPSMGGAMSPMAQGGMARGSNVMMRPTGPVTMAPRPRWQGPPMAANQQQQQQQQQEVNKTVASQQPLIPSTPSSAAGGSAQRTVVWQGTLELQDKKDPMSRINNQIPCKMTTQVVNNEPEVKTEGWPPNLVLQLIPKSILSCLGNSYFKNVHTVMFLPEACPALTILTQNLSRSMAGCVHPTGSNTNVRMIILLFSAEKKAYVGFIPIDQQSFIAKMKTVIHSQRAGGQMQRPAAPQQAAISGGGMVGGPMGPMGVGGGMQQGSNMSPLNPGPMGGQCGMVNGGPVLPNQIIRAGMGGIQQDQQQAAAGYQLRMAQVPGGMRPAGRGVMQPHMSGQGSQRMIALLHQQQMQQQQQQQQQQMMMMQQQGMRPNLNQGGMGQGAMGQGGMGQGGMGQVGMGQVMGQTGVGGALPPDSQDFMDMM